MKLGNKKGAKEFVLSIGDDGAILTLVSGGVMEKRLFAPSPSSEEFMNALRSEPFAKLSILVDVVDQIYVQQTLPPVSSVNVSKLVTRKLAKDFDANDYTAAVSQGREKTGRKEWNYLFVALKNIPPFADWAEMLSTIPNPIEGIYLLPLETTGYIKALEKKLVEGASQSVWKIVVMHNRVGGFRQVVFKNNALVFTRIAQPIGNQTPDVIAGNIEQESLNTLEYVRRLGYDDHEGLDVYVISSQDVKKSMENTSIPVENFFVITPHEAATLLNLRKAAEPSDRYGDVVMACYLANSKKRVLKLQTAVTKTLRNLQMARLAAQVGVVVVALGFSVLSALNAYEGFGVEDDIKAAKQDNQAAQQALREAENIIEEFDVDPRTVRETVAIDKYLAKDEQAPFELLTRVSERLGKYIRLASFSLSSEHREDVANELNVSLKFIAYDKDRLGLGGMIDVISDFTVDMKREFDDYELKFAGIPEKEKMELKLNLGQEEEAVEIDKEDYTFSLQISGPKDKKDKKGKK